MLFSVFNYILSITWFPWIYLCSYEFSAALQNPFFNIICHKKISPKFKFSQKKYHCPLLRLKCIALAVVGRLNPQCVNDPMQSEVSRSNTVK